VFPDPITKVYGSPDPVLSGSLVGFLPGDNVSAVYHRTPGQQAGTYLITAKLTAAKSLDNYDVTYGTAPFTILQADPAVTAVGSVCRFGDSPCAGRGSARGANGESLNVMLTYRGIGDTVYGPSSQAPTAAGRYELTVSTPGDANHRAASATASVAIVTPRPSGDVFFNGAREWTVAPGSNTVDVALSALVMVAQGDVKSARVTFVSAVFPAGIPGCVKLSVTAVTGSTGRASCKWMATVPAGQSATDSTIGAVLGGAYGPSEDRAVLTIRRTPGAAPAGPRR
jgi:hypothetical protein